MRRAYLGAQDDRSEAPIGTPVAETDLVPAKKFNNVFGPAPEFGRIPMVVSGRLLRNLKETRQHKKLFHTIVDTLR